jgi:RimK family alpha-L-glutamate ligase
MTANALAIDAQPLGHRRLGAPDWAPRARLVGRPTETNVRLARALGERGYRTTIIAPGAALPVGPEELVVGRLDVVPSLDGVEDGLWALSRMARAGARLLNRPIAMFSAHDKLATALLFGRSGVPHPRTAHVRETKVPERLEPPYVVKPRFGSWGRDVYRCETADELLARLDALAHRRWFRRQGALVQELVSPTGLDLRVVVAGGHVVGAVERMALPGEWRTNVALGAHRRPVDPPLAARLTALRAVAAVGLDLAGVDLIPDSNGSYLVLELNGAVDFTAEYGISGSDPFTAAVDALAGASAQPAPALAR